MVGRGWGASRASSALGGSRGWGQAGWRESRGTRPPSCVRGLGGVSPGRLHRGRGPASTPSHPWPQQALRATPGDRCRAESPTGLDGQSAQEAPGLQAALTTDRPARSHQTCPALCRRGPARADREDTGLGRGQLPQRAPLRPWLHQESRQEQPPTGTTRCCPEPAGRPDTAPADAPHPGRHLVTRETRKCCTAGLSTMARAAPAQARHCSCACAQDAFSARRL